MATLNTRPQKIYTHEGAPARRINHEQQLRRSLMSCLLWESEFYEDGVSIAERLKALAVMVAPKVVAQLMIEARSSMNLRHAPLWLACALAKASNLKAGDLAAIIQRPDELAEFLAMYWKDGRTPLAAQVKKGLAQAFTKFDAYGLAKYNRKDRAIRLRDVLFLCHAKPKTLEQSQLWKQLVDDCLPTPDTWEVALTEAHTPEAKKSVWERLLQENKLGALALLRNLRNMEQVGVSDLCVRSGLAEMKTARVLPFRFVAAARHAPRFEPELEQAMFRSLAEAPKLKGKTVLLVDVSGSMDWGISTKSDLNRIDAACALAMLAREICEEVDVITFSQNVVRVPPRRGFALRDAIIHSQSHGGTYLGGAVSAVDAEVQYDRMVVFTDEQSHDHVPNPKGKGYMLNVASAKNGVGYGPWTHIDGFSEACVKFIQEMEG